ncbi:hypothetical protein ONZ51_g2984 [Trametes cubensis]|uniref:BTB domain-containing protein n=1 Tax=Trametes cubensis TaxID=1111947 RepID=A0AAD7TZ30_9APHY|nr:hypothetical protein ONZ51_g2984 [Trametes cubensis]
MALVSADESPKGSPLDCFSTQLTCGDRVIPSPIPDDTSLAPHPFNKATADLVLRSRNGLNFRVRSQIIIEASPILDTKLSDLQRSIQCGGSAPILDIVADSSTLELLLRLCYPIVNPPLNDLSLDRLETTLRAAFEYEMELPVQVLVEELLRRDAMLVWCVACRNDQEDVARRAAKHMVALASLDLKSCDDLTGISAGRLYRLRKFVRLRGAVDESFRFGRLSGPDTTNGLAPPTYTFVLPESASPPDVILQSSDGCAYNAHQDVLCTISTVLCSQISAELCTSGRQVGKKGRQVGKKGHRCKHPTVQIQLEDAGAVLSVLLAFCYRLESDVLGRISPSTLAAVIAAANKYDMHRLLPDLRACWSSISRHEPLRSYFAAAKLGLSESAAQSARDALKVKLDECYLPEMEDTSAEIYRRLLTYYESCQAVARTLLAASTRQVPQPEPPQRHPIHSLRPYWLEEIVKVHSDTINDCPGCLEPPAISPYETATAKDLWCPLCQSFAEKLAGFSRTLREAPRRVSEVSFPY